MISVGNVSLRSDYQGKQIIEIGSWQCAMPADESFFHNLIAASAALEKIKEWNPDYGMRPA